MNRFVVAGVLLFVACPARAVTQAFFTSQESVEQKLVAWIDDSRVSIDMALFRFASRPLALAIGRARARGVRLRIVLDGHPEAEGNAEALGIAFTASEIRRLDGKRGGGQGIMHHKFVLFDERRVVTGSFNWTAGAEHVNYENALLTDNAGVVLDFKKEFDRLWSRAVPIDPWSLKTVGSPLTSAGRHPWFRKPTISGRITRQVSPPSGHPVKKKRRRRKKKLVQ